MGRQAINSAFARATRRIGIDEEDWGGVAVAPRQLGPPLLLVATSSGTLGPFSSATEAIQTRGRLCPCSDQGPGPIVVAIQDASNSFYMFPPRVGGASTADWRSAGGLAITFI